MKTFGKYQLIDEIGSGPAGTTYRARDTFRDSELSLKVLRSAPPAFKDQFCRELAACAELQHPHIARVHDVGEVDGVIYIATEFITGIDLRRCLHEGALWPLVQKLKFMAQICDGLAFAHRNKITHGNIKPGNIFITGNREARILDFGIARWHSFTTADAAPAPSPNYLAPEQILEQPFDGRSDLFSVAMLLYEFVAGLYPFQVPDGLIPREIVHAEPQPLRKLDPQIPEGLDRLLVRALEKDPQRRLQSADEFAVSLYAIARQLQAEQTIPAAEVSSAPVSVERARETHQSYLAAAVTAGATGGMNGITRTPAQSANPDTSIERSASSAPAGIVAPNSLTAQAAIPPAQVVPQSALANSVHDTEMDIEIEPQVAPPPRFRKGLVVFVGSAAIGILILGAVLTHQRTNASPARVQGQANRSENTLSRATQNDPSPPPTLVVQEPPAPVETPEPQPQPKQILSGPVAALWEAGNYVQALKLVDAILADDPSQAEARAWKAKIRAAQEAEASIK